MAPFKKSTFKASQKAHEILRDGRILGSGELPSEMVDRVASLIFEVEGRFDTSLKKKTNFVNEIISLFDQKKIVFSTPVLTNSGRYTNKPLSACTVPSNLNWSEFAQLEKNLSKIHQQGMGTGFCLDEFEDPISILKTLNTIAINSSKSGLEDRPVGNMATLSTDHPKILDFIKCKIDSDRDSVEWRFNLAINIDDEFCKNAGLTGEVPKVEHKHLLNEIIKANYICADPGLLFIDRLNSHNPVGFMGKYKTVAPCGEVGLLPGESCIFGYINLSKFTLPSGDMDWTGIRTSAKVLTRALDDIVEYSLENFIDKTAKDIMRKKRKIGIGICGFADLLLIKGVSYGSEESVSLVKDVMSLISYASKLESHELAKVRGSFEAMHDLRCGHRNGFLEKKHVNSTKTVSSSDWKKLSNKIAKTYHLRNVSTIALPPTGRSAQVIDASTALEPIFSVFDHNGELDYKLKNALSIAGLSSKDMDFVIESGSVQDNNQLDLSTKEVFRTSIEIPIEHHIGVVSAFQEYVDESISKTINLPNDCSKEDIMECFKLAFQGGLKGVSIYRSGSRNDQPTILEADQPKI